MPARRPMKVATKKSRFAKIASPSWTNMPKSAGGVGFRNALTVPSTRTPTVASHAIQRRSPPRAPRLAANTRRRRTPRPSSSVNAVMD
jgi:hypothetical protein